MDRSELGEAATERNSRGTERKGLEDLEFLERVKKATWEELEIMLANHRHPDAPVWKRIVISRAFLRCARDVP